MNAISTWYWAKMCSFKKAHKVHQSNSLKLTWTLWTTEVSSKSGSGQALIKHLSQTRKLEALMPFICLEMTKRIPKRYNKTMTTAKLAALSISYINVVACLAGIPFKLQLGCWAISQEARHMFIRHLSSY